jgi:putative two-component system response regulator
VHLPGESGISLAREFSRHPARPAVVMVSGQEDAGVARLAIDAGAFGYVTKPFNGTDVVIAALTALHRRRSDRVLVARQARLEEGIVERTAVASDALHQIGIAHEETVLRLSKAIEYRDPGTGGHIERMSHYCGLMAAELGLDADIVRVASRLHDIGKIALPDAILHNPGPLTTEERGQMESHAEIGHRLLRDSRSALLDEAAVIAWTHHERHDGSGYPRGLAGDDIPITGRIAAVADVFDALISERTYRPAMAFDDAVAAIVVERGRQFDPVVVDVFLETLDEVRSIVSRFDEEPAAAPPEPEHPIGDAQLCSLQEAASAIGVSTGKLRRLADEGQIASVRTAGGHRRFPRDAVRRLIAQQRGHVAVRPVAPPAEPIEPLARRLEAGGAELAAIAAASLYRGGPPGWFASPDATTAIRQWLAALAKSCESGRYAGAVEASEVLMRRADLGAATLLERHSFLERFGEVAVRALSQGGVANGELVGTRRLVATIQQAQLERHG